MDLYNKLIATYPELIDEDFARGKIRLQNDSDGVGDYIKKWEYSKPIPEGLSLGKPNA
jgi:hypothetical protein